MARYPHAWKDTPTGDRVCSNFKLHLQSRPPTMGANTQAGRANKQYRCTPSKVRGQAGSPRACQHAGRRFFRVLCWPRWAYVPTLNRFAVCSIDGKPSSWLPQIPARAVPPLCPNRRPERFPIRYLLHRSRNRPVSLSLRCIRTFVIKLP